MAARGELEFRDMPDRPEPFSMYPWLLIAAGTVTGTLHGKFHPAWLAGLGLIAFAGLYMASIWLATRTCRRRLSYLLLAASVVSRSR